MFKNSKHSYERLDFSKTLYRPIVKFALEDLLGDVNNGDETEKDQSDCIVLKEESEILLSGRSSSWSTTPECKDKSECVNKMLKYYYDKMNNWYATYNKLDVRFIKVLKR